RHIPLKDVSAQITSDRIYEDIFLTVKGLKDLFGIKKPRIVVCGLNPHASDNGIIGKEENMVIKPALERIRNKVDCQLDGPFTSDIAVYNAFKGKYDCVIAMYHDQALIPLKLTGIESGVNLTLGLPFIRTSPLHGTAFDIALRPSLADPGSLIEAVKVALRCFLQTKKRPGDVS
ncbi:MAG: 4-hydroxythreonine-4-phosphate dehydrogenase PdxA, partial [Candidatus Omnitrophica bacterium]|nr:4-hydroxythreonine-4-phosphate dehydrogenase PdxA [Candidatus Omnitrophota bacterium]